MSATTTKTFGDHTHSCLNGYCVEVERDDFKSKWYASNKNLDDAWKERDALKAELGKATTLLGEKIVSEGLYKSRCERLEKALKKISEVSCTCGIDSECAMSIAKSALEEER